MKMLRPWIKHQLSLLGVVGVIAAMGIDEDEDEAMGEDRDGDGDGDGDGEAYDDDKRMDEDEN